jgi:hypothetical protein
MYAGTLDSNYNFREFIHVKITRDSPCLLATDDHLRDTTVKAEMILKFRHFTYISEERTIKQALRTRLLGSDNDYLGEYFTATNPNTQRHIP